MNTVKERFMEEARDFEVGIQEMKAHVDEGIGDNKELEWITQQCLLPQVTCVSQLRTDFSFSPPVANKTKTRNR